MLQDRFGESIALSGETLAASAEGEGAVYVFDHGSEGWALSQRLTATDFGLSGVFSGPVALEGDTLLVAESDLGVQVFVRTSGAWRWQAELPTRHRVHFLALDQDRALFGGISGANFFVRTGDTWVERSSFEAAKPFGGFEGAVALRGDTAAVAGQADLPEGFRRVVYVFVDDGEIWREQARIVPEGDTTHIRHLALTEDTLAVYKDELRLYVRDGESWSESSAVVDDSGATLGPALAANATRLVVQGRAGDSAVTPQDVALLFERTGLRWTRRATYRPSWSPLSAHERLSFGSSLAVSDAYVAIAGTYTAYQQPEQLYGVVFVY